MNTQDFAGHPEDRELYERLLIERDGMPTKALAERDPGLDIAADPEPYAPRHATGLDAATTPVRESRQEA